MKNMDDVQKSECVKILEIKIRFIEQTPPVWILNVIPE